MTAVQSDEEQVRFLSEHEIVRDYIDSLTPESLEEWMNASRDDLYWFHWGAGQWIRNHYKLWHPDNPHTRGYRNSPDPMSGRIIERVWDELHGGAAWPSEMLTPSEIQSLRQEAKETSVVSP